MAGARLGGSEPIRANPGVVGKAGMTRSTMAVRAPGRLPAAVPSSEHVGSAWRCFGSKPNHPGLTGGSYCRVLIVSRLQKDCDSFCPSAQSFIGPATFVSVAGGESGPCPFGGLSTDRPRKISCNAPRGEQRTIVCPTSYALASDAMRPELNRTDALTSHGEREVRHSRRAMPQPEPWFPPPTAERKRPPRFAEHGVETIAECGHFGEPARCEHDGRESHAPGRLLGPADRTGIILDRDFLPPPPARSYP